MTSMCKHKLGPVPNSVTTFANPRISCMLINTTIIKFPCGHREVLSGCLVSMHQASPDFEGYLVTCSNAGVGHRLRPVKQCFQDQSEKRVKKWL